VKKKRGYFTNFYNVPTHTSCDYVRDNYKVPACINRSITHKGRTGIIVADRGHYIGVTFDDQASNVIVNVHPTDDVVYGGIKRLRTMTRSQRKYLAYLEVADCYESFAQYLGIKPKGQRKDRRQLELGF